MNWKFSQQRAVNGMEELEGRDVYVVGEALERAAVKVLHVSNGWNTVMVNRIRNINSIPLVIGSSEKRRKEEENAR